MISITPTSQLGIFLYLWNCIVSFCILYSIIAKHGRQRRPGPAALRGREGSCDVRDVDVEQLFWEVKEQKVMLALARLGIAQEPPVICGLSRTTYEGDEDDKRATANRRLETLRRGAQNCSGAWAHPEGSGR